MAAKKTPKKKTKSTKKGNSRRLTPKQERFCLEVAKGKNYSEAYRMAYNAERMRPESINRMACELMKNLKITSRIEEIQKQVISDEFADYKEKRKLLADIIRGKKCELTRVKNTSRGIETIKETLLTRVIAEDNEMDFDFQRELRKVKSDGAEEAIEKDIASIEEILKLEREKHVPS